MITLTLDKGNGESIAVELAETLTVASADAECVVDYRRFTEEGLKYWWDYAKRNIYDGIPTVKGGADKAKREKAMAEKADKLYGVKPRRAGPTADPLARFAKVYVVKYLTDGKGLKLKEIGGLGTNIDEVREKALALGVPKKTWAKVLKLAERDKARAGEDLIGLLE